MNKSIIKNDKLTIPGIIFPNRYNTYYDRANGHHFIVWSKGRNASKALIETPVSEQDILEALKELGAEPGNNLTQETWTKRNNPNSTEPDKHVKGTPVKITVEWNNKKHSIYELFKDSTDEDFNIHVGGHAHLIPVWKSGCVTCLFSCPGGKTSNAVYTIRQQAQDKKTFIADEERLPADGTAVKVHFELLKHQTESSSSDSD